MSIKRTLKSIRIDMKLKQDEMANKLGISPSSYQKKENGEVALLARELVAISELSRVPLEDIEILK